MATAQSATDPLTEHDNLTSELARLEKQLVDRKMRQEEFELLSKQLRERITRAESQAYVMARKDESLAKRLRLRNYNDLDVQEVIAYYIRTGGKMLEPAFGADRLPRYPIETESRGRVDVEQSLLQRMADVRIVEESLFEKTVSCPHCGVPSNVFLRFKCAQCSSIDISINRMIEHLQCGTIHQETVIRVGKNLICPTCKKLLQGPDDYRIIGVVCSCNNCHARFEDPSESFYCRKCHNEFRLSGASIVDVFAYSMTKNGLSEARRFLGVNVLNKVLMENGFRTSVPGTITGPTKEVVFSLIAQMDTKTIAIDVSQSEVEVEVEPVVELYVKMLDFGPACPTAVIFGAVPALSRRARDVARLHNILVAEGSNPMEMARKVMEIAAGI